MKKLPKILLLMLALTVAMPDMAVAQTKGKVTKTQTRKSAKPQAKKTTKQTTKKKSAGKSSTKVSTPTVNTLRSQRDALQKKINQSEAQLSKTRKDVKTQLSNLAVINAQIDQHRRNIGTIQHTLDTVNTNIGKLESDITVLAAQLKDRRHKYSRSMLYLYQNRKSTNKMLFLLSASDFTQMARRYKYMKEYSKYQRVQGELVKRKQTELENTKAKLSEERDRHAQLLAQEQNENRQLAVKQSEQQATVNTLQKQQKSLQAALASDRKEMASLNSKIDYYVKLAIEQERKRREEAERKAREAAERKAREAAAAAERKKQQEAANKAKAASGQSSVANTASAKAGTNEKNTAKSSASTAKPVEPAPRYIPNDKEYKLTADFASNKGRFPMPITGSYLISTHYGSYTMSGMNVRLDSKGINLTGQAGAQARCIFDGEVTAVFTVSGLKNVMVRHGSYISIYCNLRSVSVSQGQRVSARQTLGAVAADASGKPNLHFQLRKESATLNPEQWLAR
ncbi:MAG: peptidoglycan DD-metalloendopeptidase family protein [Bacteroidaceae bacterium]|nr:peptidoglycan DD-metalloendopeptidase family protein [Bacteroidaceae bacterium]